MNVLRSLPRNTSGSTAAEFTLVVPVLLLILFAIIDAGRLLWTWNKAEKATQVGVRVAVVTDLVPTTLATRNWADPPYNIPGGDPVPSTGTDSFSSTTCDRTACTPDWGYDSAAFDRILGRMQDMYPQIQAANLIISYEHVGLGFSGDPNGPDVAPLVTVQLTNMRFHPMVTSFFGLTVRVPNSRAALTMEDGNGERSN
jgi:Flp pilus assembly protein TadG